MSWLICLRSFCVTRLPVSSSLYFASASILCCRTVSGSNGCMLSASDAIPVAKVPRGLAISVNVLSAAAGLNLVSNPVGDSSPNISLAASCGSTNCLNAFGSRCPVKGISKDSLVTGSRTVHGSASSCLVVPGINCMPAAKGAIPGTAVLWWTASIAPSVSATRGCCTRPVSSSFASPGHNC